jgi:rhodanese-related sulfurtransferase
MENAMKDIHALMNEARKAVEFISVEEAKILSETENTVFVDFREPEEQLRNGIIPGSFRCPRGMMEFMIDPNCPAHNTVFSEGAVFVFYCAAGWRSAFAAKVALEMGLRKIVNLDGGFTAWRSAGGLVSSMSEED